MYNYLELATTIYYYYFSLLYVYNIILYIAVLEERSVEAKKVFDAAGDRSTTITPHHSATNSKEREREREKANTHHYTTLIY